MNQIPQEALDQMTKEGWATMEEQRAYWEKRDIGGNVLPDRIEANEERYHREGCFSKTGGDCTCGHEYAPSPDELRDAYINDIYTSFPGEHE